MMAYSSHREGKRMRNDSFLFLMQVALVSSGMTVYNAGVNGNNSRQGLDRMDRDVISKNPDVCFIAFGMNDSVNDGNFVPIDEFRSNLTEMAAKCWAAGIRPVFITINPVNEERLYTRHDPGFYAAGGGANAMIAAYNSVIKEVAAGAEADVIDWHQEVMNLSGTSVEPGGVLRSDGVHLTTEGLSAIARLVAGWIKQNSLQDSKVVAFGDSITKQGWIDIVYTLCSGRQITYSSNIPSSGRHLDTDPPSLLLDGIWRQAGTDSVQYAGDAIIEFNLTAPRPVNEIEVCCFSFMDYALNDVVVETQGSDSSWALAEKKWTQVPIQSSVKEDALSLSFSVGKDVSKARVRLIRRPESKRVLISEVRLN